MLSCCRGLNGGERPHVISVGSSYCGARRACCVPTWPADVRQHHSSCVTTTAAIAGHISDQGAFTGPQAILDRYRALLHEYGQHKAALSEWLSLITATKHRQAQLLDAEATGDAVLVSRFQQYLMIRKRLLAEIPLMREQLEDAESQQQQHHSSSSNPQQHKRQHGRAKHSSSNSTGSYGVVNANQASPVSKSQAVGHFFAAVNYRNKHSVREGSAVSSSGTAQLTAQQAFQLQAALEPELSAPTVTAGAAAVISSDNGASSSASSSSNRAEALSHLLSAATTSNNASSCSNSGSSGRAAAAALAALAYKKQASSGTAGSSSSSLGSRQQRPLAIQLAEGPPPPPGYAIGGIGLDGSGSSSSSNVVIGAVETAKADANALRSNRQLETDVSLEATLQGVPGGLGASDAAMFAATITRPAADADAAVNNSRSSSADVTAAAVDPVLAAAAAKASSSGSNEPVGEVVTAKFDVYSGRQRVMDPDALDVYFASLAEGHSRQLAAAAAVSSSSSSSSTMADCPAVQQQEKISSNSSSGKVNQKKASRRQGVSSTESGSLVGGLGLPGEIIPLPGDIIPLPT